MRSCPELAQQGSAAAQGLHDDERVVGREGVGEIEDLAARREEADVSPQPALLVDDAEAQAARVRQLRSQVLVFARAHFQKCHYNSANCSGAAGFSIPNA